MEADDLFNLAQLVEHRARSQGDAVAVDSVETGPHSWSEVHDVAGSWAGGLHRLGVEPGQLVLTMLPTGLDAIVAWVAAARIGAVEVPINHAYRGTWLLGILEHLQARVAIVDARFWSAWAPVLAGSSIRTVVVAGEAVPADGPEGLDKGSSVRVLSLDELRNGGPPDGTPHEPKIDDIACIVHTSGTTGASKGVMLPWRALQFRAQQPVFPPHLLTKPCVYFTPFGSFHVTARRPWYVGAYKGLRVVTRDGFKTDSWLSDVRGHGVTATALVGATARFVMQTPALDDDADNPLDMVAMGPILPDVDAFKERFGVSVASSYAMSEIPHVFVTTPEHVVSDETHQSCGVHDKRIPVRIVDEHGEDVSAGAIGELLVGGDPMQVNAGYYRREAETEKAWRDGWFHTGDMFRFDEAGRFYFVDRIKDAIRRRGENISTFEVENVVGAHPDVAECAVVAVPSEWSEDEVKAWVVPKPGRTIDPAELVEFCQPRMASFAVPRYVEVIDVLPRTPSAKVRKAELREMGNSEATWDLRVAGRPVSVDAGRPKRGR
jgi:carnitine-CoA ligase